MPILKTEFQMITFTRVERLSKSQFTSTSSQMNITNSEITIQSDWIAKKLLTPVKREPNTSNRNRRTIIKNNELTM